MNKNNLILEDIIYPCPNTVRGVVTNINIFNNIVIIPNYCNIIVYNLENKKLLYNKKHNEKITCCKMIQEDIFVYCDIKGNCKVFDYVKNNILFEGRIFTHQIKDIDIIDSENIILFGGDQNLSVRILHIKHKGKEEVLKSHKKICLTGKLIKEKNLIITGGEEYDIIIYDYKNLKELKRYNDQYGFVNCINYSLKNNKAVIGNGNKSIGIIDLDSLKYDKIYENCHDGSIYGLEFSKDENNLFSISSDNYLNIWNFPNLELSKKILVDSNYFNKSINNSLCGLYKNDLDNSLNVLSLCGDIYKFNENGDLLQKNFGHFYNILNGFLIENTFVTADAYGKIIEYNLEDPKKSTQKIIDFKPEKFNIDNENNYILVMGNKILYKEEIKEYSDKILEIKIIKNQVYVLTSKNIFYINDNKIELPFDTNSFEMNNKNVFFSIKNGEICYCNWDDFKNFSKLKSNNFEISKLKINKNGNLLASGDNKGFITLWDINKMEKITSKLNFLNTKIIGISFNDDNNYITVTSNSSLLLIIDINKKKKFIFENNYHEEIINKSKFIKYNNKELIVTMGMDGMIKFNKILN